MEHLSGRKILTLLTSMSLLFVLITLLRLQWWYSGGVVVTNDQQPIKSIHTKTDAYVVLSTGSAPLYAFFLPLAALTWKRRQKIEPIILLVDDVPNSSIWGSNSQTAIIQQYVKKWGFDNNVYSLGYNTSLPENNVAISQLARIYVPGMCGLAGPIKAAIENDAYVITTDVDIIPIAPRSYFLPSSQFIGKITNAYCCDPSLSLQGYKYREFPMSTLTFRVTTWRRLMGYSCVCTEEGEECLKGSLLYSINNKLIKSFNYGSVGLTGTQWSMDQRLFSYLLHKSNDVMNATELVPRSTISDRVDRNNWPRASWSQPLLQKFIDGHVVRPGYTQQNWDMLRGFMREVLQINDSISGDVQLWQQVEEYVTQYQQTMANSQTQYLLIPDGKKGV